MKVKLISHPYSLKISIVGLFTLCHLNSLVQSGSWNNWSGNNKWIFHQIRLFSTSLLSASCLIQKGTENPLQGAVIGPVQCRAASKIPFSILSQLSSWPPSIASFLGSSQQCLRSFFSFDWTFHWEEGDVIL